MVLLEDEQGTGIPCNSLLFLCWQLLSEKGKREITIIVTILDLQKVLPTSAPREEQPATGSMYLISLNLAAE